MKFVVKYSEDFDRQNYLDRIWKENSYNYGGDNLKIASKYLSPDFLEKLKSSKTKKEAENIVNQYWKKIRNSDFEENSKYLSKWFSKILNNEKNKIIKPLENIYQEKFPFEEITVYLTTFPMCPYYYEKRWYMVYRNSNLVSIIDISKHELNHFMFYYYWKDYLVKQNISNEKIEYLKEAFAVLTSSNPNENIEKPNIFPIQNFVKNNKNKPIKDIIDLVIKEGLLK